MRRQKGVTLIELMVAIAVIAIAASIAVPGFSRLIEANRIASAGNELIGFLSYSRSEARRRGRLATVVSGSGVLTLSSGGGVLRILTLPTGGVSVAIPTSVAPSATTPFAFRADGLTNQVAATVFDICGSTVTEGTRITVSVGGEVSSASITCN